jgi:hypothetical protein
MRLTKRPSALAGGLNALQRRPRSETVMVPTLTGIRCAADAWRYTPSINGAVLE